MTTMQFTSDMKPYLQKAKKDAKEMNGCSGIRIWHDSKIPDGYVTVEFDDTVTPGDIFRFGYRAGLHAFHYMGIYLLQ